MRRRVGLGLVVLLAALAGCAGHLLYPSGPFRGRVVDAETEQPLAGAAVVIVWWWDSPGLGHAVEGMHDAVEVVTDAGGEFTVPQKTHVILFGEVTRLYVVIYYPGYKDFLGQKGFDVQEASTEQLKTVELVRAKTREERLRYADMPTGFLDVPDRKIPNLIRLVNVERKALGLQPTHTGE